FIDVKDVAKNWRGKTLSPDLIGECTHGRERGIRFTQWPVVFDHTQELGRIQQGARHQFKAFGKCLEIVLSNDQTRSHGVPAKARYEIGCLLADQVKSITQVQAVDRAARSPQGP